MNEKLHHVTVNAISNVLSTNLLTESEFRNGLTDAPARSGVSASSMSGFLGALHFDGNNAYAYKNTGFSLTSGLHYVFSAYVMMDDGSMPVAGVSNTDATADFCVVVGNIIMTTAYVELVSGTLYRIIGHGITTVAGGFLSTGLVKYSGNSTKLFKFTGFMLERIDLSYPSEYIATTTGQGSAYSLLTFRFVTGKGFTSLPSDIPPNVFSEPRIIQPGLFRQSMYAQGTTSGASSGAYGEIVLINPDGALDNLMDLGFDGQLCVIKEGEQGQSLSSFKTVLTGVIEQCEFSWDRISFRLKDSTKEFQVPVQYKAYSGTNTLPNGIEGTSEIKNKVKPMLFGNCKNITPVCVNTSRLIYQVNDGPVESTVTVRDMGVDLEPGNIYNTLDELYRGEEVAFNATSFLAGVGFGFPGLTTNEYVGWTVVEMPANVERGIIIANTTISVQVADNLYMYTGNVILRRKGPAPGSFDMVDSLGLFRLGSMPAGQITADVIQGLPTERSVPKIISKIVRRKMQMFGREQGGDAVTASNGVLSVTNGIDRITGNNTGTAVMMNYSVLLSSNKSYFFTGTAFSDGIEAPVLYINNTAVWTGIVAPNDWAQPFEVEYVCNSPSFVGMGFLQTGVNTGHFVECSFLSVKEILGTRIVGKSLDDLEAVAPYEIGIYIDSTVTYNQVLDSLCQSVGAWWGFDNNGLFWCTQLDAPVASAALLTLTKNEITAIERVATADGGGKEVPVWKADRDYGTIDGGKGVPLWRVNVFYNKNWTKQTSLAGSVPASRVIELGQDSKRVSAEDSAVKKVHALASEIMISTMLTSEADALAEANRVLALRKIRRDRLRVSVAADAIAYDGKGYWDDTAVADMTGPRWRNSIALWGSKLILSGGQYVGNSNSCCMLDLNNPTGSWDYTTLPALPGPISKHTTEVYNNYLYLFGGEVAGMDSNKVYRLNLNSSPGDYEWMDTEVTDFSFSRYAFTSFVRGSLVYVLGGFMSGTKTVATWSLDLATPTGSWVTNMITDLPAARAWHAQALSATHVYIIGGIVGSVPSASVIRLPLSSMAVSSWDDAGVTDLPIALTSACATVLDNYLYVMGGSDSGYVPSSRVFRLNLSSPTGAWEEMTALPSSRDGATCLSYGGSILLFGGYTTTPQSNTYQYRSNGNPADRAQLTSMGRTVLIQHPRYGYTSGRPMKIIGVESDFANGLRILDLWG